MTITQDARTVEVLAAAARDLREHVDGLASDVAREVNATLPDPDEQSDGSARRTTELIEVAIHRFLDEFDRAPHRDRGVDERFQKLGATLAQRSERLADFHAAARVATSTAWTFVRRLDFGPGLTPAIRGAVADALFAYVDHLVEQTEDGHAAARARMERDQLRKRARLAAELLQGRLPADDATWTVPEQLVVAVAELSDDSSLDRLSLSQQALVVQHDGRLVVLFDPSARPQIDALLGPDVASRVAFSWAVHPTQAGAAYRWARRSHDLVANKTIPDQRVIECRDHRTAIWLHAEPALRQGLVQELLPPLMAETPNSREILSETLLVWLETRDSAPAIAAILDVHPQTVRYRWKRINELFGEDLHDPEFVLQLTMILKASLPLWKAGDQSDFERFRAGGR